MTYSQKNRNSWVTANVIKFLLYHKERVERGEIAAGTLRNYKPIKLFLEQNDIELFWRKITRGLPKSRKHAADRAPTIQEIQKLIEYPDRRIKAIVFTMLSSGIRLGAWDYLKWSHITPITQDDKILAAKIVVYGGHPKPDDICNEMLIGCNSSLYSLMTEIVMINSIILNPIFMIFHY